MSAAIGHKRCLILVHPPQQGLLEGFSSGLIALANFVALRLPDVDVRILDLGILPHAALFTHVAESLKGIRGQVFVGITTTTASYQAALSVAQVFKRLAKECIVVLGGHHASSQDDVVLQAHTDVDLIVRGEGEASLVELLIRYPELSDVPSLSYRDGSQIIRNPSARLLDQQDLDQILPNFRDWGLRSAPGKFDHVTYVAARGCPLQCAFCSVANERIRSKSIGAVVRDLRILVGEFGFNSVAIEDNFFAHSPKRTIELCGAIEELQKEISFRWDCQTRVESCRRTDVMESMERAGCEAVYLGVEAFDPEHLLYLKKTPSPGPYVQSLREQVVPWLLRSRINCYINLQLGLPGEDEHHRDNTLKQLAELGKQAADRERPITIFPQLHVVYPGTRHFHEAVAEGRFGRDSVSVFERFTAWEARQKPVLEFLGEHFAHGTGGIPEGILCSARLGQGEFAVDGDAVIKLVNYLNEIENLNKDGLILFKYGRYLTNAHDQADKRSFVSNL